jgi:hypothetical protein
MRNLQLDFRSFVEYECEMAVKDYCGGDLSKIVVIYNYANVDKDKCPDCIKDFGQHLNGYFFDGDKVYWNYQAIKASTHVETVCELSLRNAEKH